MEKRWIRRAWGGPPKGWVSKTAPDEPGYEISSSESGPRAHTRRRVEGKSSEMSGVWWRVESCFPTEFPPMCRSASPHNLRFPAGEELAGKSHRRQGDPTAEGSGRRIK